MKEIIITGQVHKSNLVILEKDDFKNFLYNYGGRKFIGQITIQEDEKSKQLLGYYWDCVIPRMMYGFRDLGNHFFNKRQVDKECRKLVGIYAEKTNEDLTGLNFRLKSISEMDNQELYNYIEALKIIAAVNMSVFIEDPIIY